MKMHEMPLPGCLMMLLVLAVPVLGAGCATCAEKPMIVSSDGGITDATTWPTDAGHDEYAAACKHLSDLGCPEANPQDAGLAKCAAVLRDLPSTYEITPACIQAAHSSVDLSVCHVRCVH